MTDLQENGTVESEYHAKLNETFYSLSFKFILCLLLGSLYGSAPGSECAMIQCVLISRVGQSGTFSAATICHIDAKEAI